MEHINKKQKTTHRQPQETFDSGQSVSVVCAAEFDNGRMEEFIPKCYVIASIIFKHLSVNDILNLSKVSRNWFIASRDYLSRHSDRECLIYIDQVDGVYALDRLCQLLDSEILGQRHPYNGIHFQFSHPLNDFFKAGSAPYEYTEESIEPVQPLAAEESANSDDDEYDYTQDYESFEAWMYRQAEEARFETGELHKVNGILQRVFSKIPMKHIHIIVKHDKKTKRHFQGKKFNRFVASLPVRQIESFHTNLRISEFVGNLNPGQMCNLKTIAIDEFMNALPATMSQLFAVCPALEKWDSPIPGCMIGKFGTRQHLIKNLSLNNFVTANHFKEIHNANLSLTTLIANTSICAIPKTKYEEAVRIIRENSGTLKTIQMTEPFLKHVLHSDLPRVDSVREIIIHKCTKATKTNALVKFPNARFVGTK